MPPAFHRVPNSAVAQALQEVADILEIEGESAFRVRAYRSAAQYLANLGRPVAEIAAEGGRKALIELPSVGASIADKILEILATGRLGKLQELRREVPPELSGLLAIPGLGPKTVRAIWQTLNVTDLAALKKAIDDGSLLTVPRMGQKAIDKIKASMTLAEKGSERLAMGLALPIAQRLVETSQHVLYFVALRSERMPDEIQCGEAHRQEVSARPAAEAELGDGRRRQSREVGIGEGGVLPGAEEGGHWR